jgi:histidine ammonia-lyase
VVRSQAHAIGAAVGLAMDQLAVALGQLAIMSERRVDRLVNPLVSGLPPFLATENGSHSGFMIAQYAALSLLGEIRRLAAPASLDAGITSGLQEDFLAHPTPASLKTLHILRNLDHILAIEFLAAAQAYDLKGASPAPALAPFQRFLRRRIATYRDDRPLGDDIAEAAELLRNNKPLF